MSNIAELGSGLSEVEAAKRLEKFGRNEFEKKKGYNVGHLLVQQFKSPLIYVLLFAGLVSLVLKEALDAVIILFVVFANTLLGFWQEFKAAKSLEALKSYLKPKVIVIRDGERKEILMTDIVPGDLVYLDAGGSVPADGVVVESTELYANEALLTGESRAVNKSPLRDYKKLEFESIKVPTTHDKKANSFVYMGTTISSGLGMMLVVRTGSQTEMGKIAKSLAITEEEATPLQKKLSSLARNLVVVVMVATSVIFVIGVLRGEGIFHMFETSVAMAVAAIPEGLAVSMTVILALGMQRIFKRKALVRKLVAAETLGSVSVICCDKTGTLTEGKMKLVGHEGNRDSLIMGVIFANDERDAEGLSMSSWAQKELNSKKVEWSTLTDVKKLREEYPRVESIPFDSKKKFITSVNEGENKNILSLVGAPEVVLHKCNLPIHEKEKIKQDIRRKASEGFRLIGVATKQVSKSYRLSMKGLDDLEWAGFVAFQDPIRDHVKQALESAKKAGVKVKVITGDYKETAIAVFRQVLGKDGELSESQVMTGEELNLLGVDGLNKRIKEVVLFARTTPDQKLTIVKTLKAQNEVVAMTGDGVNDAPALKAADIGVVVNEASDVSKQTADMVLLDSNFRTIVEAIREGRVIYETMRKVVAYLLTDAFQELILIGGALLFGLPLPITAVQILWINLVEDSFISVALAFDATDDGVMNQPPRGLKNQILDKEIKTLIGVVGVFSNIVLFALYAYLLRINVDLITLQTFMFVGVATNSLFYVFSIKSLRRNIWQEKLFNNKYLIASVLVGFGLTFASIYLPLFNRLLGTVPLSVTSLLVLLALGLLTMSMVEVVKWVFAHRLLNKTTNYRMNKS